MKHLLLAACILTTLTFCSKKKSEDPQPEIIQITPIPNNNTTKPDTVKSDTVKKNPIVFKISEKIVDGGEGKVQYVELKDLVVSDSTCLIESVTGNVNTTLKFTELQIRLTPISKVFAGVETLNITVKSGSDIVTKTIKVRFGSLAAIQTFKMLQSWFDIQLTGTVGNFYIKSDGTITSNRDGSFYNSSNAQSATYIILDSGYLFLDIQNMHTSYLAYAIEEVTATTGKQLLLTDVTAPIVEYYSFWK